MEKLPAKVIEKACQVLGLSESLFDRRLDADQLLGSIESLRVDVDRLEERVKILEAEKERLETEKRGLLSVLRGQN
jgi:ubiquinone biosynthesis protein UbiJ